jgi:hypothetical protein
VGQDEVGGCRVCHQLRGACSVCVCACVRVSSQRVATCVRDTACDTVFANMTQAHTHTLCAPPAPAPPG